MASEFVGSTVLVTLHSPPNAQLRGIVQDLQNRILSLRDVFFLDTRTYMPSFSVPGNALKDLEIIPTPENGQIPSSSLISAPGQTATKANPKIKPNLAFVDPAILSMERPPAKAARQLETIASATLSEPFSSLVINSSRPPTSELATAELTGSVTIKQVVGRDEKVSSPVQQAFQDLMARTLHHTVGNAPVISIQHETKRVGQVVQGESPQPVATTGTRKSGGNRGRTQRNGVEGNLLKVEDTVSRKVPKKTRKHNPRASEAQNGWATEEATDIQELGEFDFEANLSKFDKREIFRQLKEDDSVAAGDRLVAHNRLPKPGTAGGRNFHWSENVLDSPLHDKELWNSEAGETADDLERVLDSGRSSARQKSQSRSRMATSRKGSHNPDEHVRRQSQITARQTSFENSHSPRIGTRKTFTSPYVGANTSATRYSLRISGSNRQCPIISPIQMLELEQHAIADLGLNEDILTENAARGIASLAIQMYSMDLLASPRDIKLVIAVGNHKTGTRTLAAARHLKNRGYRTTVVIMSREEDALDAVRQQANAFTKAGGSIIKPAELLQEFQSGFQPTLLIEALTGMHISFEDLRREDQQWCFELAIWSDRLKTPTLSVDVPAGIDPSSAAVGAVEGHSLAFRPDVVVALGAPKPYLLSYMEQIEPSPKVYVADLSLGRNAWKRLGGKRRTGIDFGHQWLVEISLQNISQT